MRALLIVAAALWSWSAVAAQRLSSIRVGDKYGYIDSTGRVVIAPTFDGTWGFDEGLAAAEVGGKWGFIDATGKFVVQPRFAGGGRFSEGLAAVPTEEVNGWVNKYVFIDTTGRTVLAGPFDRASDFHDGRARVGLSGTYGYIDRTGKVTIAPRFQDATQFSQGLAAVWYGSRDGGGYIDTSGALVVRVALQDLNQPIEWCCVRFSEGLAPLPRNRHWGFVNRTGTVVIAPQFDEVDISAFHEGLAAVRLHDRWGFVDTTGAMVIQPQFEHADRFQEGLAAVMVAGKFGFVNRAGQMVIAPRWGNAWHFSNGLSCVLETRYGACYGFGAYIDHTGKVVWQPGTAVAAVPAPAPPDTTPLSGSGPLVDRVTAVVDRAEAAERGQPVDRPDQIMADATKAAAQLTAYLNGHPDDVRALILSVRLGRFSNVAQPVVTGGGRPVPTFATLAAQFTPHHASLNRALALEPNNAEAHYWKARLYGLSHDWIGMLYGVSDVPPAEDSLARAYADSAIRFGRRAVELAPDREPYREALAIYLILSDQEREAATVLQPVAGGKHPMSVLLADWAAIPVPPGAVPLRGQAQGFARMQLEEGMFKDYPFLRIRMYAVPLPMDSVQAFYAKQWAGFRLVLMETQQDGGVRSRTYSQYLQWRDGRVVPARNKAEIPEQPTTGMPVLLLEITNPPAEARAAMRLPRGRVISSLTFIDLRSSDAH